MKHLRVSIYGQEEHAMLTMARLGIEFEEAIPQPIGDQWWFLNCTNIPDQLPENITELKLTHDRFMDLINEI